MSHDAELPEGNMWNRTFATFTLEDGTKLQVGAIGDHDEDYETSDWLKIYRTHGASAHLSEWAARTYARLLALRSRVEAERGSGFHTVPLLDVVVPSQLETAPSQPEMPPSPYDEYDGDAAGWWG